MEDIVTTVVNIVSNVGFPIACVAVMFYQMEQERKSHKEESDKWIEAINNNTKVMEKVLEKVGV